MKELCEVILFGGPFPGRPLGETPRAQDGPGAARLGARSGVDLCPVHLKVIKRVSGVAPFPRPRELGGGSGGSLFQGDRWFWPARSPGGEALLPSAAEAPSSALEYVTV